MGKPYLDDLALLPEAVRFDDTDTLEQLSEALYYETSEEPMRYVASGGSMTAAHYAAMLHEYFYELRGEARTPLEIMRRPVPLGHHCIISAGGGNLDVLSVADYLCDLQDRNTLHGVILAVCASTNNKLMDRLRGNGGIWSHRSAYGFASPGGKDGFLATKSLMVMMMALTHAYANSSEGRGRDLDMNEFDDIGEAPRWLGSLNLDPLSSSRTIVALSAGWGTPALWDFESRCAESGLASVMATDWRNFSHGRHQWLVERGPETCILSLEYSDVAEDADRFLALVPPEIPVVRIRAERTLGPAAAMELVVSSMYQVGEMARCWGIDPGQPRVSDFGRRMYANVAVAG